MDGRTDRQADRQGQILMHPDYRHGGIKSYEAYCWFIQEYQLPVGFGSHQDPAITHTNSFY